MGRAHPHFMESGCTADTTDSETLFWAICRLQTVCRSPVEPSFFGPRRSLSNEPFVLSSGRHAETSQCVLPRIASPPMVAAFCAIGLAGCETGATGPAANPPVNRQSGSTSEVLHTGSVRVAASKPSEALRIKIEGMNLAEAIGIAISRHPDISRAMPLSRKARLKWPSPGPPGIPALTYNVQPGYGTFGGERKAGLHGSLGVTQLIYDFGKTPRPGFRRQRHPVATPPSSQRYDRDGGLRDCSRVCRACRRAGYEGRRIPAGEGAAGYSREDPATSTGGPFRRVRSKPGGCRHPARFGRGTESRDAL